MKVTGQPCANAVRLWISCPARKCYLSRVLRSRTSLEHGCASSLNTANHVNVEENMAFGLYVTRDGSVMVAYGQRHIPISGPQYKANGYKPPSKNWRPNHPPSKRAPIVVTSPTRPASPRPSPDRPAHGRRLAARARCRTGDCTDNSGLASACAGWEHSRKALRTAYDFSQGRRRRIASVARVSPPAPP